MSPTLAVLLAQIVITVPDRPVHEPDAVVGFVEPHVASSVRRPSHLVAAAISVSPETDGVWTCSAFSSFDAGNTWRRHDFNLDRCIDPWVVLLDDGAALVAALELDRDIEGDGRFRLVVFRSDDGGATWPATPTRVGDRHEHPIMTLSEGVVYLASRRMRRTADDRPRHTVGLLRSDDGGRSFRELAEIRASDLALNVTGVSVLDESRLVVTYADFQRDVDGFDREGILDHPRAWALLSSDGGASFAEPRFVSEDCGVKGAFPGYPHSAGDAVRNRVYFACVRPELEGIVVHRSDDGGERWSDPVRIDAGSPYTRTPMLAVDENGVVGAAWYDRRRSERRDCQDLYFTASVDGGAGFAAPVRVSTEPSCPETDANGRIARSWPMGGDYTSLAPRPGGGFVVVWSDSRGGRFGLRTASIRAR